MQTAFLLGTRLSTKQTPKLVEKKKDNLYLDENVIRIVALQVALFTFLTLIFSSKLIAILLSLDFAIRAFTGQISPFAFFAFFAFGFCFPFRHFGK